MWKPLLGHLSGADADGLAENKNFALEKRV